MDELVTTVGSETDLLVEMVWERSHAQGTSTDVTRGALRLLLRASPVWFGDDADTGFEWTWVELLEFLATAWPFLILEDGAPLGLQVGPPAALRAEAIRLADDAPDAASETIAGDLDAFFEVHELSRALQGAVLPEVLFVRTGSDFSITSDGRSVQASSDHILATLEALGEAVANRLDHATDERSHHVVSAWRRRADLSPAEHVAVATGLSSETIALIEQGRPSNDVWEIRGDRLASNELLAAARMCGDLPAVEIRRIVEVIRDAPLVDAPALEALRLEAEQMLTSMRAAVPHSQGYELARWLRERLELSDSAPADAEGLLSRWGLPVTDIAVSATEIDAVACWGPSHGPAIFVNTAGRHSQSIAGRRSSVAHELLHLLVDRSGALPLADVLGGRASSQAEARARAFAAEFLLPRSVAGRAFQNALDPGGTLFRLKQHYLVSAEVAAWQARNSAVPLSPEALTFLRQHVSHPQRF